MNSRRTTVAVVIALLSALGGTCEMMPSVPPDRSSVSESGVVMTSCASQSTNCATDSGAEGAVSVVAADFDNDGVSEFAVAFEASRDIVVYSVTGSCPGGDCDFEINFTPRVRDPVVSALPLNLLAADFDRDGRNDLVFLNGSSVNGGVFNSTVTILRNVSPIPRVPGFGTIGFEQLVNHVLVPPSQGFIISPFSGITIGDFNGDGAPDIALVVLTFDPNKLFEAKASILILLNDGVTGRIAPQQPIPLSIDVFQYSSASIVADNFVGDTADDLVVTFAGLPQGKPGSTLVLENLGNATFTLDIEYSVGPPAMTLAADFNNDFLRDFAVVGSIGAQLLLKEASGSFARGTNFGPQPIVAAVAANLNGDSNVDIAAVDQRLNVVQIMFNKGGGVFFPKDKPKEVMTEDIMVEGGPQSIAAGDINGDGRMDLIVTAFEANEVYYILR